MLIKDNIRIIKENSVFAKRSNANHEKIMCILGVNASLETKIKVIVQKVALTIS